MSVANHRVAFRPLRGGTLIFQPDNNEAGTLGTFLTSNGADRFLLTCFHVLARQNALVATDRILQPSAANGVIGTLGGAIADQALDCAAVPLAIATSDEVLGIGRLSAATAPIVGARVIKSGWKTGISEGRIRQIVGTDVVIERLPGYPMDYLLAEAGDSGAVWVEANTFAPVALHKRESAVGPHLAFATDFRALLGTLGLQQV